MHLYKDRGEAGAGFALYVGNVPPGRCSGGEPEPRGGNAMARKYGKKSQKEVKGAMHEFKRGKLKSGRSGKRVSNRKQAIAIGLSKARKKGAKVPPRRKSKKS
jgi:Family of unknown function (DUF6496)